MTNLQHLILAYKHLSKLSLSGVFDFDMLFLGVKRRLKDAILLCVTEDEFIKRLHSTKDKHSAL